MENLTAFCFRNGVIRTGRRCARGTLKLARGPRDILLNAIAGKARLAYDNVTWLVPGIPEAKTDDEALVAAFSFRERLRTVQGLSVAPCLVVVR